jgi:hypothetical protein
MNKKIFIIFLFSFLIFNFVSAELKTFKNLGFAQNGIWYSKDPFFADDRVRIYTAIFNSSVFDLSGVVEFYDNGKPIDKALFSVGGGGRIKDVWINWTAVGGQHKISAKIIEAKIQATDGKEELIFLENSQTGVSERFIDIDTDKDGIGNIADNDDDDDGAGDAIEIKEGTDPLVKNIIKENITSATSTTSIFTSKPAAVAVNSVKYVVNKANKLADKGKEIVNAKKEEVQKEIEKISNEEIIDGKKEENVGAEKPIKYAYLLALSAASLVFSNKILFYIALVVALYYIFKLSFRAFKKKKK